MKPCECGSMLLVLRLVDTDDTPARRAAVVRCGGCDVSRFRLTPRMVAVLAASSGRMVRPGCGAVALALQERGISEGRVSSLLTDDGVAIVAMIRVALADERESGASDHAW